MNLRKILLFRGKRIDTGELVEGGFFFDDCYGNSKGTFCYIIRWNSSYGGFNEFIKVIPETVSQFTGKTDKTGKLIFDGDIVEFDSHEWGSSKSNLHHVSWDDINAEWDWGGGTVSDMHFRTIVGNIYDNPELILLLNNSNN